MRVKLLLALAIASVLLFCAMGVAAATTISGVPTAAQLTALADQQSCACGFPDLSSIGVTDDVGIIPADNIEATVLESPICGVCGECQPCNCVETTTIIPGPQVNLGCPLLTVCPVPVNLVSPVIRPVFPAINVAPQALVNVPQVNAQLNCFDIACQPVTNINNCLPCKVDC
jgi:hypothetical protein